METKRETWPRLDLVKAHLTSLMLACPLSRTPELEAAFAARPDSERHFVSAVAYTKSKTPHVITLVGHVDEDDHKGVYLTIEYRADREVSEQRRYRRLPSADDVAPSVAKAQTIGKVECHLDFEYSGEEPRRLDTFFPLPFKLGASREQLPKLPLDEIWGIRGLKLDPEEGTEPAYSFILDRSPDEDIALYLWFDLPVQRITTQTPREVMNRATEIAGTLVFEGRRRRERRTDNESSA